MNPNRFTLVPPPANSNDIGNKGYLAYDSNYIYVYPETQWKRVALTIVRNSDLPRTMDSSSIERFATSDTSYFFLFTSLQWHTTGFSMIDNRKKDITPSRAQDFIDNFRVTVASTVNNTDRFGQEKYLAFDNEYLYVYSGGMWRKVAISEW